MTRKKLITDGHKMKQVRKKLQMSQAEFADALDREQPAIAKYENDERGIPNEIVKVLNTKFAVSYEWWYNNVPPMMKPAEKTNLIKDIGIMNNKSENLEQRVAKLERLVTELVRDYYAEKHGV